MKRRTRKLEDAKEYLRAWPHASTDAVVRVIGCSPRTVYAARKALRLTENHEPVVADHITPRVVAPVPTEGIEDLDKEVKKAAAIKGEPLTNDELEVIYSNAVRLAKMEGNVSAMVAAGSALDRLRRGAGDANRLGPGPPLTQADKIERTSLILDVVGPKITADAAFKAWERPELDAFLEEIGKKMAETTPIPPETTPIQPEMAENA